MRFFFPRTRNPAGMILLVLLYWPIGFSLFLCFAAILAIAILFVPFWVLGGPGRIYTD